MTETQLGYIGKEVWAGSSLSNHEKTPFTSDWLNRLLHNDNKGNLPFKKVQRAGQVYSLWLSCCYWPGSLEGYGLMGKGINAYLWPGVKDTLTDMGWCVHVITTIDHNYSSNCHITIWTTQSLSQEIHVPCKNVHAYLPSWINLHWVFTVTDIM